MGVSYKGFSNSAKISGLVLAPAAAMDAMYNSPPNWITTAGSLGAANGGVSYAFNLSASDPENQPLTYILQSGSLPTGLSLSSEGIISGTPTNIPGTSNFIVRVSDGQFYTDRSFSLDVTNQTPIWQTAGGALTAGTQNSVYNITLLASDPNNDVVTYSVTSGSLPTGITLNSSTGVLFGTPSIAGSYSFTVRATDALSDYVDRAFSITVVEQSDTLWSDVSLLAHFDSNYTDQKSHSYSVTGAVAIDNTDSKYGTGSLRLTTGGYVAYNMGADSAMTSFTIEFWIKLDNTLNSSNYPAPIDVCGITGSVTYEMFLSNDGRICIYANNPVWYYSPALTWNANQWYHIALVWNSAVNSGTAYYYRDGALVGSGLLQMTAPAANQQLYVGSSPFNYPLKNARLDDFRVTKSVRYTGNFTPPTAPFPNS